MGAASARRRTRSRHLRGRLRRASNAYESLSPTPPPRPHPPPDPKRYLQSQRDVRPAATMAALTTAAAPLLFWAFISKAGLGLDGAALAFITCQAITLAGLVFFTVARAKALAGTEKQTWTGWSGEAFTGWGEYMHYGEGPGGPLGGGLQGLAQHAPLALLPPPASAAAHNTLPRPPPPHARTPGVPAAAHICAEWWAYEIVILWAGLLPDATLALSAMGLCLSINAYLYMLPLGLSSSVNTNVANALGGGDAARARGVVRAGLALSAALQAALVGGLMLG
jgi:hypothetical protein